MAGRFVIARAAIGLPNSERALTGIAGAGNKSHWSHLGRARMIAILDPAEREGRNRHLLQLEEAVSLLCTRPENLIEAKEITYANTH